MAVQIYDQPLDEAAMTRVMTEIMTGKCPPKEISVFLSALAKRGETAEEIAAAVQVLRAHAVSVPVADPDGLCDTCGTGGDGQSTMNVSTLAALLAAGAGVRVAKHGNRAASSRCGSADVLEALGVNLEATPQQVARCIDEAGFGFCFAPRFHPAMKAVAPVRKALGIRTIFNLIGPLANPVRLTFQLIGVSEERLMRPMAEALIRLKIRRGLVVHGTDGLDEVTTTAETLTLEVRDGAITPGRLSPARLGVPPALLEQLRGGDAAHNARIATEILRGVPGPAADLALVNAGCAIHLAEEAASLAEGIAAAREAAASGRARRVLERVKELTHAG